MLSKILLGIAAVLVAFAVVVAFQPAEFQVVRTTTIAAGPAVVFSEVNDFHQWNAWSPWAKLDPAMKQTHEGAPAGTGAIYSWAGNREVGEGRMTITESRPNELIRIKLEFLKPFAATNTTEFTFKPVGAQTSVTWNMTGEKNFISKAMCLFVNMDKMVGGDFEKGLAALKSIAESRARKSQVRRWRKPPAGRFPNAA
ncbi:MAG: SRPBCC family protein [Opitutaceae bacterium]